MARKREQASQTLERLGRRRGGSQLTKAAVLVRRAAVAIAAIGLVTVGIVALIGAVNRSGAGRVAPGPAVPAATDDAGTTASGLGAAPTANVQAGTASSSTQPAPAAAAAPAPGTQTAWLPLPEFQGSLTAPGRAAPAAAQAPSVVPSGQPIAGPTEPTEPVVVLGNNAGGGADEMPTRAGWSRAERGSATEGRTPPPPTTHAASPETGAGRGSAGPARGTVNLPGPPTVEIPKPVLPRILVGARGGEGASAAPPSSAGTSGASGSSGGAGDTKSTLAALVDSVLGSHRGSRGDR